MGTGIVFVVLVAIWVAYFVQYWSRRREHLATARSVEAFSEAMRVLERRPVLRAPSGDRISTAYAVSPARAVGARPAPRPQVIAKPHAPTQPSPSRGGVPRMSSPQPSRPQRPSTTARRAGAGRPPQSRPASVSPSRRVRGLVLLGSVVTTIVLAVLAAISVLLPWTPLIGAGAAVASFLWVRAGVRAEQAARRARRSRSRQRQTVRRSVAPHRAADVPVGSDRSATAGLSDGSGDVGAVDEAELVERTEVTAQSEGRPDGWQPVPVPPPTYTLKAKAERPTATATVNPAPTQAPDATGADMPSAPDAVAVPEPTGAATVSPSEGEQPAHRTAAYGT
ncbi:MAG: hypothetical protein WCA30_09665 [Dermatophilaceae bacterium]